MRIQYWGLFLALVFTGLALGPERAVWTHGTLELARQEAAGEGRTRFVFGRQEGVYAPAVDLVVRTQSGRQVLRTRTRGPWLVLDLPVGRYVAEARQGSARSAPVRFRVNHGNHSQRVPLTLAAGLAGP